jgi:hypothetical protein
MISALLAFVPIYSFSMCSNKVDWLNRSGDWMNFSRNNYDIFQNIALIQFWRLDLKYKIWSVNVSTLHIFDFPSDLKT